jgi:hypothetical protein
MELPASTILIGVLPLVHMCVYWTTAVSLFLLEPRCTVIYLRAVPNTTRGVPISATVSYQDHPTCTIRHTSAWVENPQRHEFVLALSEWLLHLFLQMTSGPFSSSFVL